MSALVEIMQPRKPYDEATATNAVVGGELKNGIHGFREADSEEAGVARGKTVGLALDLAPPFNAAFVLEKACGN